MIWAMASAIHPINYGTGPTGNSVANAGETAIRARRSRGIPANRIIPFGPLAGTLIGGAPDSKA